MRRSMPPADEVSSALQRIVASAVFSRSERARDLLRYLVEQDLAGNSERLKGYSIAVDVFGKSDRFDPSTDAVVRVQAGRLRDLIEQYYAKEGAGEALRISIPLGGYVPEYEWAGGASDDENAGVLKSVRSSVHPEASVPLERPSNGALRGWVPWRSWPVAMLAGGILALGAVFGVFQGFAPVESGQREIVSVIPAIPVAPGEWTGSVTRPQLPAVYLQHASGDVETEKIAGILRGALASFDTVDFIARLPGADPPKSVRETDFLILIEPGITPGEVNFELQNIASGKVLMSLNIASAGRSQQDVEDDISDILTSTMPASGVLYAQVVASGNEAGLTRCLIATDNFYRNQSPASHRAAYDCLAGLPPVEQRSPLVFAELASLNVQAVAAGYDYPPDASLENALLLARAAVQLGPNSPSAHRAMGYVLAHSTDRWDSVRWLRKAHDLNPLDLSIAASYGYGLVFAGDYENGAPVLARAVAAASAHPPWWDYALFLSEFMLSDMEEAANAVSALRALDRAHYLAARLIVADQLEREEAAATLLASLQSDHSEFAANPGAFYRNASYPEPLTERLVEALRLAGLFDDS